MSVYTTDIIKQDILYEYWLFKSLLKSYSKSMKYKETSISDINNINFYVWITLKKKYILNKYKKEQVDSLRQIKIKISFIEQ